MYKLWMRDRFVVFSPEIFVRTRDGLIYSYPMKGTIDATLPDARRRILDDPKEAAEHATIVDLIRNDLSIVASEVCVPRYRYIDELRTHNGSLLQVSSEIRGRLPEGWNLSLIHIFPSGRNTGRYAVLARRPIPLPPGQPYGYLPLASLYSPLCQRYSFVVLILLSYLIGCSYYSIKLSGYCIVTQCREPCCLISGRQLIPTISRSGNASRKAALAISSFGES